ncbi:MAG TPA: lipopolysaccharide biosynthesis protein [Galbitalea sp.]|nr:lipopolysaccharide biosynthesis protein [Galbitalea sp.]
MTPDTAAPAEPAVSPTSDRPELSSLGRHVRRGLGWKAASQMTAQITRTAMTIILAHLLAPSAFGLAGMVLLFIGLIQLLADVGFSASLVQLPTVSEEDRSTAFWMGLGIAVVLFGLSIAAAPAVAAFYHAPRLRWMFVAVATGFITTALSTTQASLLWRRMEFRALEIRAMLSTIVSAAVGIGAAAAGLGTWSLILQANALSVTSMIAVWFLSPWKPHLVFSRNSLGRIAGFSSNVLFARFLDYGDRNADNLLIGRVLGSTALGIYSIGYSVIIIPFTRLADPIRNLITPALAALQRDLGAMRALWLRGTRAVASIVFPVMVGVIVVCPDFVPIVLGNRWRPATTIIEVLAWVGLIQSVSFLSGAVYQSCNRSGLLLQVNAVAFALDLASFIVGLHWGVRGVAIAYALMNTVVVTPLRLVVVTRLLGYRLRSLASELRGITEATVLMAAATLLLREFLELRGVGDVVRLPACIVVGMIVYAVACRWREPRVLYELKRLRPSV